MSSVDVRTVGRGPGLVVIPGTTRRAREIRAMLPTIVPELRQVAALDSDGSRYADVTTPTLLISGGKSPAYLRGILPTLAAIMPYAKALTLSECDHNAPDQGGPEKVAAAIRA